MDDRTKRLMLELDESLGAVVRGAGPGSDAGGIGVFSVADELQYWQGLARGPSRDRERAGLFVPALEPLVAKLSTASAGSADLVQLTELVEDLQAMLDTLWRVKLPVADRFPAPRMQRLLTLIGASLAEAIGAKLGRTRADGGPPAAARPDGKKAVAYKVSAEVDDMWRQPAGEAQVSLRDAVAVCEAWEGATTSLTTSSWSAASDDRPWPAAAGFVDEAIVALRQRLLALAKLRAVYDEAASLCSPAQLQSAGLDAVVLTLQRHNAVSPAAMPASEFEAAVAAFDLALGELEPAMTDGLRRHLSNANAGLQMLASGEAGRYASLLLRPRITRALTTEREGLLAAVSAEVSCEPNRCHRAYCIHSPLLAHLCTAARGGRGGAQGSGSHPPLCTWHGRPDVPGGRGVLQRPLARA